jgi:hypothetical protein
MKAATGTVLCLGWLLACSTAATADTFYRYRDKATGRDVFVNRLEQVPQCYRDQVKIVFDGETAVKQDDLSQKEARSPTPDGLAKTVIQELAPRPPSDGATSLDYASAGTNLLARGPAVAAATVDAKLGLAGAKPLAEEERAHLARLWMTTIAAAMAASLCAFVVWIVLIVSAFRNQDVAWGVLMIVLSPLALLYLFLHFGKGKWVRRTACTLGLLSPGLVGMVAAWRFFAWFQAVVQARGGHL